MKVLITGATGLVGRRVYKMAHKRDFDVITYGRSRPLSSIGGSHCYHINELKSDVDLIIHCASATPFNTPLDMCMSLNEEIDMELVNIIGKTKPAVVAYLSTMAVYGDIRSELVDERYVPLNTNIYGASKLKGEILLQKICKTSSVGLTILRLPGVVDKDMHNIFFKRCYDSLYSGHVIRVRSRDAGFNNAILADDVFKTVMQIVRDGNGGIINLHSADTLTIGEFLELFAKLIGRTINVVCDESCSPSFTIANSSYELDTSSCLSDIISTYHTRLNCD